MPSEADDTPQRRCQTPKSYRPSIFLLCALIFWTGISTIAEIVIPFDLVLFSIATYAPTFYFAAQSIVRSMQGIRLLDTPRMSRRTKLLTASWVLNLFIHLGLWLVYRHDAWGDIFLLPTVPAGQCILVMVFIAVRYTVDIHMTSREQGIIVPRDVEDSTPYSDSSNETTVLPQDTEAANNDDTSPRQEEEAVPTTSNVTTPDVPIYRPSILLLFISIFLSVYTAVLELRDYSYHSTLIDFLWVQAYLPAILLHTYLVVRILQKRADTLKHATKIAGLSFDLIPLWLGTRFLIVYIHQTLIDLAVPLVHLLPGSLEVLLIVYFAVRYTRSVYVERRRQIGMGFILDDDVAANDSNEVLADTAASDLLAERSFYRPSVFTLLVSIGLSVACAVTECLAEPICGILMTIIVYAPTIVAHLYLSWRQHCNSNTTLEMFTKWTEWSMILAIIWLVTQAFYLFIWPVSLNFNAIVMNPWIRWPQVVLILYIAARYLRERYIRNSAGAIRLPPDTEEVDSSAADLQAVVAS